MQFWFVNIFMYLKKIVEELAVINHPVLYIALFRTVFFLHSFLDLPLY